MPCIDKVRVPSSPCGLFLGGCVAALHQQLVFEGIVAVLPQLGALWGGLAIVPNTCAQLNAVMKSSNDAYFTSELLVHLMSMTEQWLEAAELVLVIWWWCMQSAGFFSKHVRTAQHTHQHTLEEHTKEHCPAHRPAVGLRCAH